jgi:hypothetical protein
MAKRVHPQDCVCAICSKRKPFVVPEHLLSVLASGEVVLFVGAGISTENRTYCQSTFFEEVRAELKITEDLSFPELMSKYCESPTDEFTFSRRLRLGLNTSCHLMTCIGRWRDFTGPYHHSI